jgi:hypothetical protein
MMKAALPGAAFGISREQQHGALFSCPPPHKQALPPRELHDPLPDDKRVLWPSPRRPLRRNLAARWEGWR